MDLSQLTESLQAQLPSIADSSAGAPVNQWRPPYCGDIPLHINFNGEWRYQNSTIKRAKLISLFASILKREEADYFLVSPVEKVGIQVDDVPFVLTDWEYKNDVIWVQSQTGLHFPLNEEHPVWCQSLPNQPNAKIPYTAVRSNLYARFHQNVYYQMVEHAEIVDTGARTIARLKSGDSWIEFE